MSNVNIGTLLDEFNINTPGDYAKLNVKDRSIFLSRIKTSAEHTAKEVLTELKYTPGLKMHFHVKRLQQGGWENIPNEIFARKMAFFASKSVITVPFDQMAYWKDEDVQSLLKLLCFIHPFLKAGLINVLPSNNEFGTTDEHKVNKKYGLVSANFHLDHLETQFEEKVYPTVVANLYLPYFSPINPEDIIRIRNEEKLIYDGYENDLSDLLNGNKELDDEEKLLTELKNIDKNVRRLTVRYEAIQDAYKKKNIYMLIGFATVGLVMLFPPGIVPALTQVLGSIPILDYFKFKIEESDRAKTLKEEEYYLLWRLNNLSKQIS